MVSVLGRASRNSSLTSDIKAGPTVKILESAFLGQGKSPSNETVQKGPGKPFAPETCLATRRVVHIKENSIKTCTYKTPLNDLYTRSEQPPFLNSILHSPLLQ